MGIEAKEEFYNQGHVKSRVPSKEASFTVGDIRNAIPPHCFKHSLLKSFGYLFRDLIVVFAVALVAIYLDSKITAIGLHPFANFVVKLAVWLSYWAINGCVMTGLWVIGHECGHGGFSNSAAINNVVGFIVHSALLVPFFSWQISHRRHHSNTGNIDKDEVFVPAVREKFELESLDLSGGLVALKNSISRFVQITIMMTLGWPLYLLINATGHKTYPKGKWVNHFIPTSPIFAEKERLLVIYSDLGLLVAFYVLYRAILFSTFLWVVTLYVIPLLIVNFFLVLITFLQHTDYALPHYTTREWDWIRGALATIDRDFGILNGVFHHITDTHVVHHLFSKMPFYHAKEATEAVKPLLGEYYRYDRTHWLYALWVNFECSFVQPDPFGGRSGVLWFHPPVPKKEK
jgi:omega-6 fatty acid desaturase (delta-12 desaturase)